MRAVLLVLLVLFTACKRPEVEAFIAQPSPVTVAFAVPASVPGYQALEREYAAALRARLATRIAVVPEGLPGPEQPVLVTVQVTDLEPGHSLAPAQVGVATGVAVSALGLMTGNRHAVFNGFFWGLWAGGQASGQARADRHEARVLGYRPRQMTAQILVTRQGLQEPFCDLHVSASEVVEAMDPLRGPDRDDEFRIREEEAKAMARVVVAKLQERFRWTAKPKATFYRPGAAPAPAPELAPESPVAPPSPALNATVAPPPAAPRP